jgi:hypothetical protein
MPDPFDSNPGRSVGETYRDHPAREERHSDKAFFGVAATFLLIIALFALAGAL